MMLEVGGQIQTAPCGRSNTRVLYFILILTVLIVDISSFQPSFVGTKSSRLNIIRNVNTSNGMSCLSMLKDDSKPSIDTDLEQERKKDRGPFERARARALPGSSRSVGKIKVVDRT